jgi:predicted transcriptional regulator
MSHTISVRLTPELAEWLETTARKTGVPQRRIVRQQLELAKTSADKPFMRLAGSVGGPRNLSRRKGFAKK